MGLFSEPARFNEPKPYGLHPWLSDDNWAALKLRVDPLARNILDPHRSYAGAAFLCLLMTAVFSAVRPGWSYKNLSSYYDDDGDDDDRFDDFYRFIDDYYNNDGVDDVILAEWSYRNEELDQALLVWRIMFCSFLAILLFSTVGIAIGMEQRNAKYDKKIRAVCDEMRPRFQAEGFSIEYRTRADLPGVFWELTHYIRPERVFVFKPLSSLAENNCQYSPPPSAGVGMMMMQGRTRSGGSNSGVAPPCSPQRFMSVMVQIPRGYSPGQVMNVATPSGSQFMVAVPSGMQPGQTFTVNVPIPNESSRRFFVQHQHMPGDSQPAHDRDDETSSGELA